MCVCLPGGLFTVGGSVYQPARVVSSQNYHISSHSTNHHCVCNVYEQVMEEVDLAKVADSTIGGGDFYTLKGT